MFYVKLLAILFVGAAGVLKLWTDPARWGVILAVIGGLVLSWMLFVAVLYLTAARLRRDPEETRRLKSPQQTSRHVPVGYVRGITHR